MEVCSLEFGFRPAPHGCGALLRADGAAEVASPDHEITMRFAVKPDGNAAGDRRVNWFIP